VNIPDDLLAVAGEGHSIATDDAGYAVAVDTRLTPELADEGLAREVVHRIQNLRKAAGLEISDRIVVYYAGLDRLSDLFSRFGDYVREETLADELRDGSPPDGVATEGVKVEGSEVVLGGVKVG
jgi:isoleucyl-tRNA synthetase